MIAALCFLVTAMQDAMPRSPAGPPIPCSGESRPEPRDIQLIVREAGLTVDQILVRPNYDADGKALPHKGPWGPLPVDKPATSENSEIVSLNDVEQPAPEPDASYNRRCMFDVLAMLNGNAVRLEHWSEDLCGIRTWVFSGANSNQLFKADADPELIDAAINGRPQWVSIGEDSEARYAVDSARLDAAGPDITVDLRTHAKHPPQSGTASAIATLRINCQKQTSALLSARTYDARGRKLGSRVSESSDVEPEAIFTGTTEARVYAYLCPKAAPLPSMPKIVRTDEH